MNNDIPTCSSRTGLIFEELKKVTSCLNNFSESLELLGLKSVETMQVSSNSAMPSSSGTDGSAAKGKRKVSAKASVSNSVLN